jgi:putative DNA primase/helicase
MALKKSSAFISNYFGLPKRKVVNQGGRVSIQGKVRRVARFAAVGIARARTAGCSGSGVGEKSRHRIRQSDDKAVGRAMIMDTIERARGRWREILPQLGVETRFLTNRQGPCPMCGGKTRFRFDDKGGEGTFYCNKCGAGTGLLLARKLRSWDHKTACDEVDKIISRVPAPKIPASAGTKHTTRQSSPATREAAIRRLWNEATRGDIVADYLTKRRLGVSSPALRGHPRCPYFDDERRFVGNFPALIAPITAPDGQLESLQRIYHADVSPGKKTLPAVRTISRRSGTSA